MQPLYPLNLSLRGWVTVEGRLWPWPLNHNRTEQQRVYESTFQNGARPSLAQLDAQRQYIEYRKAIRNAAPRAEDALLDYQCIHYEPDGSSAIEGGIYSTCRYCSDVW